jgi:general stress protein YciG
MSGTKAGGIKAAATNRAKHGEDFYVRIGKKGGHNSRTGGFASDAIGKDGLTGRERARMAGTIGGFKSRRGPAKRDSSGRAINADGSLCKSGRPKKEVVEIIVPEGATRENIHLWQKLFRHGETSIGEEDA